MALLTKLLPWGVWLSVALLPLSAGAAEPVEILYDQGNPDNSIGIIGDEIYSLGDLYERYRISGFEPEAIVLENMETRDAAKLVRENKTIPESLKVLARHHYVVKQLKNIYAAQLEFRSKMEGGFAPAIEVLIVHGFLDDGFKDEVKHGYRFHIVDTYEAYGQEPAFSAVAEPEAATEPKKFFYVNQLGLVRSGDSLAHVSWGPAWDYEEHRSRSLSEFAGVDQVDSGEGVLL